MRADLIVLVPPLLALATTASALGGPVASRASPPAESELPPRSFCSGAYADDFGALSSSTREFDHHPEATFSYCTRNAAVYECLSYGPDGAIRRERKRARMHGTAFAYKRQGDDALLLTNEHVAAWPAITDAQHTVDGVPAGCKKISESLSLVDDERDSYARDDIPVTMVVSDPQLDVAVLKARSPLQIMRWKVGSSAALRERNVVEVRGFPLGAFRATNVGKVVSAHDHDDEGGWNHDDFVTDALLSSGNSGSPVLAISCATGEYELVGIFHAGYTEGSALNVVVGIDQVRDLMTTLKRSPPTAELGAPLDRAAREQLAGALDPRVELVFPFGGRVASARSQADGSMLFALYAKDYPFSAEPVVLLEDRATTSSDSFGDTGRVWFGSSRGLRRYEPGADVEPQTLLAALQRALRTDAVAHASYRRAADSASTRQLSDRLRTLARTLQRTASSRADLVQAIDDQAERLSPQASDRGVRLVDLLAPATQTTGGSGLATGQAVHPALGAVHP